MPLDPRQQRGSRRWAKIQGDGSRRFSIRTSLGQGRSRLRARLGYAPRVVRGKTSKAAEKLGQAVNAWSQDVKEQRRFERNSPPLDEQMITIHGYRKHVFGRVIDESTGGLGIELEDPMDFRVGERLLLHRLHQSRLRLATVRHVESPMESSTRMGVQWCMH